MKKLNLGEGGVKGLVTQHIEKVVFGICVLLVLVFVYTGFRLEGYDHLPTDIKQQAEAAQQHIRRDSWEAIADDPQRITETNYPAAVKLGNTPTRGALYPYEMPLQRPLVRPLIKRSDPELYAPVKLIVRSMNAPIAIQNKRDLVDKLADLENAKPPEPPKRRERQENRPQRTRGGVAPDPGAMTMMPMEGAGLGMPEMAGIGGVGAPPPVGAGGAGGLGGSATAQVRMLTNPEGWRPGGGGMGGMGMMPGMADMTAMMAPPAGGSSATPTAPPIAQPAHINAILFLVPYEKQYDEYKNRFEDAVGYNPMRDRPNYMAFVVQRAEVPEDPNAELQWESIGGTNQALRASRSEWAGVGTEVAHQAYVHQYLTMPIPPILLRDFEELALHPDIPRKDQKISLTPEIMPNQMVDPNSESEDGEPSFIPSGAAGMTPGMPGASPMAAGMMPMGAPGMAPGAAPGMAAGMAPGMGPGMGLGMGAPPALGMGGMMAPGAGMGMYGSSVTEWKLGRYFDLTAEPGKKYRYRVRLLIEDPNHPRDLSQDVMPQMLTDEAAARVAELNAKEPKQGERKHYYRATEWSEPSDPVSLPPFERFFAGEPSKAPTQQHKNGAEVLTRNPIAKMVGVVWDSVWGLDISHDMAVTTGSVLNAKEDVEAVHPLTLEFKVFKDYLFQAGACVVDMRGGVPVGGESNDPLLSPAEFAVVDAQGNLVVHDEIEDLDRYRRYAYVDQTSSSGTGMGMPGGIAPGATPPPAGLEMPAAAGVPGAAGAPPEGGGRGGRARNRR